MTKRLLAVVLAAVLSAQCFGQTRDSKRLSMEEQVRAMDSHSPVEVRMLDRSKLRGWIGEVSGAGFVLSHEQKRRLIASQIAFSQMRTVAHSSGSKWRCTG